MKYSRLIATIITMAFSISAAAQGSTFISGLEDGYSFIADKCGAAGKATSFSTSGKSFKVMTFYYNSSTVTAVEDAAGKRSILFIDGKPNMPTSATYPKIGYNGANELKTNEYAVGPHDFTDDGQPELVIGARSASGDGLAIYVFGFTGTGWRCLGEMVTAKRDIRSSRVFRQTVTIKDATTGVLYTWTYHDGHFDFLSSDHVNDPSVLY